RLSRRPWPVVAALGDSLDFQLAIGKPRIEQRVRSLASYFRRKAAEVPHVVLYTSNDPALSAGITSLGMDNVEAAQAREYLRQRYDVYTAVRARGQQYPADPHGVTGFRVPTLFYNRFERVERVLAGLGDLANGKIKYEGGMAQKRSRKNGIQSSAFLLSHASLSAPCLSCMIDLVFRRRLITFGLTVNTERHLRVVRVRTDGSKLLKIQSDEVFGTDRR